MNIEAYNLDFLRKLVRDLQKENQKLKIKLDKANIAYDAEGIFIEDFSSVIPRKLENQFAICNQII